MMINICPRLIEKMVRNGHKFIDINIPINPITIDLPCGLYATKPYTTGSNVRVMTGTLLNSPTKKSIHIGYNMHLEDEFGQYINHSFEPNVKIVRNKLVAIKDINIYDEITFNYNETELEMAFPFEEDGIPVCGKKNEIY